MRKILALMLCAFFATHALACGKGERGVWVALVAPSQITSIERCYAKAALLHDQFLILPGAGFDGCLITVLGTFHRATIALTCSSASMVHRASIGNRGVYAVFEPRPEVSWRYDRESLEAQLMLAQLAGNASDAERQRRSLRLFWPVGAD